MDPTAILARAPLFANLADGALDRLASAAERVDLESGECLYAEGERATHFCLLVSGRLRVTSGGNVVGYVGLLEPVGEMGVVVGEPRAATVEAVRDSIVLRIANSEFLALMQEQPATLLALSRLVIRRMREQGARMEAATERGGTLAVIAAAPELPTMTLAEALVRRLSGWPDARLITARHVDAALGPGASQTPLEDAEGSTRLATWLSALEARHSYVVYAAESDSDAWALRCLHNADRVLVVAEAAAAPAPVPVLGEMRKGGAPVELLLLRPEGDSSPHTESWRERTGARAHYFLHPWDERELAALARQLTGSGLGLVLGGGGARGFAHIGLIRALEQLAIPVDLAGGASMGAFIGALLASGLDSLEMTEIARETFVSNNYLNDYTFPRVSLLKGRRFLARLEEIFGDRQIEDLRRTFYCVSTNLTSGGTMVHDSGPLAVWVGTSMSIPGVAPPVAYEGELFCDGGVVDNLPTDVIQGLERGSIVASNVGTEGDIRASGAGLGRPDPGALLGRRGSEAQPRLSSILMRTATLTSATAMQLAAERADVYIRMPCEDYGLFDWKALDQLVELGYEHAMDQLAPLRDTLANGSPTP